MTKKSRVNKDAFDWVDGPKEKPKVTKASNTATRSKQEANHETVKSKSATKAISKVSKSDAENLRTIYIAFKKNTGDIVATQEFISANADSSNIPWSGLADDITAKAFTLTDEIAKKELIDIHKNYKVTGSGKLELKSR